MKNVFLILSFLVVPIISKLKANTYDASQRINQLNSFSKSSAEDKLKIALDDVSMHNKEADQPKIHGKKTSGTVWNKIDELSQEFLINSVDPEMKHENEMNTEKTSASEEFEVLTNEEETLEVRDQADVLVQYIDYYNELEKTLNDLDIISSSLESDDINESLAHKSIWYGDNLDQIKNPQEIPNYNKDEHIDYYNELRNILGDKFEDVEVVSKRNNIENLDAKYDQVVQNNAQENISTKKSKVYAVHPYQPKGEKAPPSMHGPVIYLINEDEDESSPLRYYQQYGRTSNPQYSYLPKKKDHLAKIFPGLATGSNSNNQPLKTKTKFHHDMVKKGSLSKIALERLNTGWPFGYDLTQMPAEYSIMHKVHLNHHPHLALMKQKAA